MNFADLTNAGFPTWDELLEDLKSRGSDWEDINAYRREYWKTLLEVDEVKNMKEEERKKYEEEFFPSAGIARSGLAGLAGGIVREIPSAISDVAQSGYEAMKPFLYGAPLALADQIDKVRDWVTGNERQSDLLQKISTISAKMTT